jgi:sarcosine oxidase subunit gamma
MSEAVSALSGATASGFVRVEEAGLVGMITIRGDLSDTAFQKAVKAETGVEMPGQGRRTTIGANALLWMSPDELMLTCPHEAAPGMVGKLTKALEGVHALVENVSDARAVFHVTGVGGAIRDALGKVTPADLRPSALPANIVRRTRLSQVPAALWFEDEGRATIVCFRSVARYTFDLLSRASETGSDVGYFRQG